MKIRRDAEDAPGKSHVIWSIFAKQIALLPVATRDMIMYYCDCNLSVQPPILCCCYCGESLYFSGCRLRQQ